MWDLSWNLSRRDGGSAGDEPDGAVGVAARLTVLHARRHRTCSAAQRVRVASDASIASPGFTAKDSSDPARTDVPKRGSSVVALDPRFGERLGGRKGSLPRRDQLLVRCVLGGLVVSTPRSGYIAFGAVTGAEGAAVRLPGVRPATPVSTEGWAAPGTVVLLGVTVRLAEPTWSREVLRTIRERPAQEATGEVAARWMRATSAARAARPTTW
jgi:hypothetical protein